MIIHLVLLKMILLSFKQESTLKQGKDKFIGNQIQLNLMRMINHKVKK